MWKAAGTGMRAAQSMPRADSMSRADSILSLGRSQVISSSPDEMQDPKNNPDNESNRRRADVFRRAARVGTAFLPPLTAQQDSSIGSRTYSTSVSSSLPANDDSIIDPPLAPRENTDNQDAAPPVSESVQPPVNTNVEAHSASVEPNVNPPPRPPTMSPEQRREEEEKMMKLRDEVLSKTGRQNGPDIALKVIFNMKDQKYNVLKQIINENSSITEVMNVFAFLVNTKDNRTNSIVKEFSFFKYEHDTDGNYTPNEINENDANYEQHVLSVFKVLENVNVPLFDIDTDTFKPYTEGEADFIILPAGIIKRDAESYHTAPIKVFKKDIPKLFTLCILQMINILEKTRGVFGGWTKLFKEMQGGGTKSKSTTKKTRRSNNCRRN